MNASAPICGPTVSTFLCAAALLLVYGCAQKPSKPAKDWPTDSNAADSRAAAEKALAAYRTLKGLPDDPDSARLGQPFDEVWLRLDALQAAAPDAPLKTIKTAGDGRVIYPVLLGAGGTDGIVVHKVGGAWKPAIIGGDFLGPRLAQLRDNPDVAPAAAKAYALSVPALNANFLAYERQGKARLIPVLDYPQFKLKGGEPIDADLVTPRLIAAAKQHDGQPG